MGMGDFVRLRGPGPDTCLHLYSLGEAGVSLRASQAQTSAVIFVFSCVLPALNGKTHKGDFVATRSIDSAFLDHFSLLLCWTWNR